MKYVLTPWYRLTVLNRSHWNDWRLLRSSWRGSFAGSTSSNICFEKNNSSGLKPFKHRASVKHWQLCLWLEDGNHFFLKDDLPTDHKPLKYPFAPDEEIPKMGSTRITTWAIALMGIDYELKNTPAEQIPMQMLWAEWNLTKTNLKTIEYASQSIASTWLRVVLAMQAKTKKLNMGKNKNFTNIMKRIISGNGKQCPEVEKGFEQKKDAKIVHNSINYTGVVPSVPPKLRHLVLVNAHRTHSGKKATQASVRTIA